jgi:hypothetical protein
MALYVPLVSSCHLGREEYLSKKRRDGLLAVSSILALWLLWQALTAPFTHFTRQITSPQGLAAESVYCGVDVGIFVDQDQEQPSCLVPKQVVD